MPHAKNLLILGLIASFSAASALAQVIPLPPPPGQSAVSSSQTGPTSKVKPPMGEAAGSIAIGKQDSTGGFVHELEKLQKDAVLAELRAKIATASGKTSTPAPKQEKSVTVIKPDVAPAEAAITESSAQLVNVSVADGIGRADVRFRGFVKTYRDGDFLGSWKISSISPGTVVVTKEVKSMRPLSDDGAPLNAPTKSKSKSKTAKAPREMVEFTQIVKRTLQPYIAPEVVAAANTDPAQPPGQAVVPPLPVQMNAQRPVDSTAITPAAPMRK